jgi:hypothetical protein
VADDANHSNQNFAGALFGELCINIVIEQGHIV